MNVRVQLFAAAREHAGADSIDVDLPIQGTVADIRRALLSKIPQLNSFGANLRFAVDADYAEEQTMIPPGAEVACIPPVSGG